MAWRWASVQATLCSMRTQLPSPKRGEFPNFQPCLLRPNGWMDQDETWHAGRPRPWPHCVRWGPSSPSSKRTEPPPFSTHIWCGQMAGWIKMPLGTEVGLGSSDFVVDGDQLPSPKRGPSPIPNFRPMSIVAKRPDGSRWHLAWSWASVQATLCSMKNQLPSPKRGQRPQFSAYFYCHQTA